MLSVPGVVSVKYRSSIMVGIYRSLSALDGMLRSTMNCLLIVVCRVSFDGTLSEGNSL